MKTEFDNVSEFYAALAKGQDAVAHGRRTSRQLAEWLRNVRLAGEPIPATTSALARSVAKGMESLRGYCGLDLPTREDADPEEIETHARRVAGDKRHEEREEPNGEGT